MGMVQMRLHDGTILMHGAAPYDPVKAHEYYIRTRKLKGRNKGTTMPPVVKRQPVVSKGPAGSFSVTLGSGRTIHLSAQQLNEQKAFAAKRVHDIQDRIKTLTEKLHKSKSAAKKRESTRKRNANKPQTAAEKAKAARDAKQYRAKHKTSLKTKAAQAKNKSGSKSAAKSTSSGSSTSAAHISGQIAVAKKSLATALSVQKALAGATKN
jgi:hypothetical protein